MVHLSISALKGNQGGRTYPYAGYLGLSKLTVEGIVRTRVEDDSRLLRASSLTISVRCYEARTRLTYSKVNLLLDATQTLWTAADGLEYDDLGSGDFPFRILLPSKVSGFSTIQHPDYRVFWRLEAAINHEPSFGLGSRQLRGYDLTVTRYDLPDPLPPPSFPHPFEPNDPDIFQPSGALAFLPPCQYRIVLPSTPITPSSTIPIALALRLPTHSSSWSLSSHPPVALYSVSVVLERRMDFYEATGAQGSPEFLSGTASTTPEPSPATSSRSTPTPTPSSSFGSSALIGLRKRSASPSAATAIPAKSLTTTVASAERTLHAATGRSAELTLDLAVPPRPPPSQWPLGETTRTDLATIAFYVRVKVGIVVQSPLPHHHHHHTRPASESPSSSNAAATVYEYELPEREVRMMSVTEEERAVALARVAERRSRSAAGSRRPSAGAADAAAPTSILAGDASAASGPGVPPLPKGANTVKFGVEDTFRGGLSAAMLNTRLKSVKASREDAAATDGAVGGSMSNASTSGSSPGSSACSSTPSTSSSSGSNSHNTNPPPTSTSTARKTRSKTPLGTRRPQTVSGMAPSAQNSKEIKDLARMRRSQSGQATYGPRSQSEVVTPATVLDAVRPHWAEREREHEGWNGSIGSGRGCTSSGGNRSDSDGKVRSRKASTTTATATATTMGALDVPVLTPSPVPSKDGAPTYAPAPKTIPPSPTRPIPPPPASPYPDPNPNRSVYRQPSSPPTHAVPMTGPPSFSSPSPSPSPSPPASVSSHAYGHAHIPRASLNASARSSPNLLMSMGIGVGVGADSTATATWGRNKQRRPRGDSNVSSRSGKFGFLSSLLSARA